MESLWDTAALPVLDRWGILIWYSLNTHLDQRNTVFIFFRRKVWKTHPLGLMSGRKVQVWGVWVRNNDLTLNPKGHFHLAPRSSITKSLCLIKPWNSQKSFLLKIVLWAKENVGKKDRGIMALSPFLAFQVLLPVVTVLKSRTRQWNCEKHRLLALVSVVPSSLPEYLK